jgi:hypothetical protein
MSVIVIKINKDKRSVEEDYYIVPDTLIVTKKLCETPNGFGGRIGCYDASCYSRDNSACEIKDGEEENHTEVEGIEYWDGHNWQWFQTDNEYDLEDDGDVWKPETDSDAKEILDAYDKADFEYKDFYKFAVSDKFEFTVSPNHFSEAVVKVRSGDEE